MDVQPGVWDRSGGAEGQFADHPRQLINCNFPLSEGIADKGVLIGGCLKSRNAIEC